jgi:ribonuclease J
MNKIYLDYLNYLELAKKYKRKVFFYNDEQREILRLAESLGYYKMPVDLELPKSKFNNSIENLMIIVSGSGPQVFKLNA